MTGRGSHRTAVLCSCCSVVSGERPTHRAKSELAGRRLHGCQRCFGIMQCHLACLLGLLNLCCNLERPGWIESLEEGLVRIELVGAGPPLRCRGICPDVAGYCCGCCCCRCHCC